MRELNKEEMAAVAGGDKIGGNNDVGNISFNHSQNKADSHAFPKQIVQGVNSNAPSIANNNTNVTL